MIFHKQVPEDDPKSLIRAGYRFALALTHHHYDAEDLVQQASLKCFRKYGKIKSRSLLFTVIRNLFYDQQRRRKDLVFEEIENDLESQESAQINVSGDLDLMLAHLKHIEREVLYLNAVEGYTASEISKFSSLPRSTVLSHLHRARKKLSRINASGGPPTQSLKRRQTHE